jgi:DNA-binding transcriptional ArsR family regulator
VARPAITKRSSSPAEVLAVKVRDYLHMPDGSPLFALIGALAANMLEGPPVWLMLVGPPSCGKTELLNSTLRLPRVFEAQEIESPAAFLSGTGKKEKAKDATGGLLRQVGDHGAIVIKDFTSIMSLPADKMRSVLGVFRQAYDGRWTRPTGTDGGKTFHWEGHVAFFSGVTGEVDRHHQINASLGERWLYYRFPEEDGYAKARRGLRNASRIGWQEALRGIVRDFFEELGLSFGGRGLRRELTDAETIRVIRLASIAARARSAVVRDGHTKEVIGPRETEMEGRIAGALGQLLIGLERIGLEPERAWELVAKIALDSMPKIRRMIFSKILDGRGHPVAGLARHIGASLSTVRRAVEDLEIHGVVETEREDGRVIVKSSSWLRSEWKKAKISLSI